MKPVTIHFLSIETVLRLHEIAIADQGGDPSLRDRGLLESALAMPQQQFSGEYLHPTIPAMAAAYAFHIGKNHPFVDGNKRAAFAAMLAFLTLNAWKLDAEPDDAERTILSLAGGTLGKEELTTWVERSSHEKPSFELRDFFHAVSHQQLREGMAASVAVPQGEEFSTSLREAEQAITMLREIRDEAAHHHLTGNAEGLKRCGVEMALLMHLYRLAEDMGYEW
ncbi:MAG: type II toxin-antitoxin system death-on-curing family toxin [Phycisphaerales bacterium]|nr:type II toxin-antitoxin system death-on-curing family toxin [Phycisphaerales bacterium]